MDWQTFPITQSGNSTVVWSLGPHPFLSTHDIIVPGPFSGTSRVEIERIRVRQTPTNYLVTVRVTGSAALGYRLYGQKVG